ncbi:hypothetical protein [Streptomyces sp. NPDC001661]
MMSHVPVRDASVVAALDDTGHVAILSAPFPEHGGDFLFLPGGRREVGEDALRCFHPDAVAR